MRDGAVLTVDERAAARALQEAGERMWSKMDGHDWGKRTADELSPQTFPAWTETPS